MASTAAASSTGGAAAPPPVDMSIRIGNRIVTPALPVVDGLPPTSQELSFQRTLDAYVRSNIPLEDTDGIRRRERVLDRMGALCRSWIMSVCTKLNLPRDAVDNAGGQLYTSGSYRLGVHEPGADIDTILVAPNVCTREDFFGSGYVPPDYDGESDLTNVRDPNSLAERIKAHPDVTNFVPVENAAVPILTFDWEGVNIDLLFARLNSASVPPQFDIDDDGVLSGVDAATEKSLNGPRVTNLIAALVSGTTQRYQSFLTVVRCIRKWAKARGLYSNKLGYWGGVNINIAVALVVQLYPNACPASLVRKFFLVFKSWRWPNPVMLTKPHDAQLGLTVWSAFHASNARQVAPVITPAYPAMNSTLSVSRQTLQILHEEFCRGHDVVDKLWRDHRAGRLDPDKVKSGDVWSDLFEPSDFFISYPHYLSLCIVGPTLHDAQSWTGFVESRLRKLVSDMLGKSLPLSKIQLWPKKFDACVADRTALLTHDQRSNSVTYFVGFRIDRLRMRGSQLDVERQLQNFRTHELSRFSPLVRGMDVLTRCFAVKELPKICFDNMYDGGKIAAMKKRRRLIEADPKRQERKRLAKLEALKKKMAEMQQKKEEARAAERKRKREEEEEEEDNGVGDKDEDVEKKIKAEEGGGGGDGVEESATKEEGDGAASASSGPAAEEGGQEEEALLEDALDAIQSDAGAAARKTREEAEADRRRLLAGELLVEGMEGGEEAAEEQMINAEEGAYGGTGANAAAAPAGDRVLTREEREAQILRNAGYAVVSDDEAVVVGGNMVVPWRRPEWVRPPGGGVAKKGASSDRAGSRSGPGGARPVRIRFRTHFDVVELDANGHVIDKGDEDFQPSPKWTGRRGGFEFKLGERGLGYYRTGKKVVVPSNTAY